MLFWHLFAKSVPTIVGKTIFPPPLSKYWGRRPLVPTPLELTIPAVWHQLQAMKLGFYIFHLRCYSDITICVTSNTYPHVDLLFQYIGLRQWGMVDFDIIVDDFEVSFNSWTSFREGGGGSLPCWYYMLAIKKNLPTLKTPNLVQEGFLKY